MCVLPLLSGGISSWRQGRGNPLRHTTTHTDTGVSLDSPSSSSTTTSSMPLGLLRLLFFYPNPHPPPSLPRPGRLSSAPSLLFIFSSASLCCLLFSVSLSLFLFIRPLRITFTNALKRSSLMRERKKKDIYWYRQPKFLCLIIFVVFLGRMSWGCYQSQYL